MRDDEFGGLDALRQTSASLSDPRRDRNGRYARADAASCALPVFFLQFQSFLTFRRRMQREISCSNRQKLFGVEDVPCDNRIHSPLDGLDTDVFGDLFPLCLDILRDYGALQSLLTGRCVVGFVGCVNPKTLKVFDGLQER